MAEFLECLGKRFKATPSALGPDHALGIIIRTSQAPGVVVNILVGNVVFPFPSFGGIKNVNLTFLVMHLKDFVFKAEVTSAAKTINQTAFLFGVGQPLGIADVLGLSLFVAWGDHLFGRTVKIGNHVLFIPEPRIVDMFQWILRIGKPAGRKRSFFNLFPCVIGNGVQESKGVGLSDSHGVCCTLGGLCCKLGDSCRQGLPKTSILNFGNRKRCIKSL
mmetsp:Transcript_1319/g.1721  ORF Transcript_1319/g.1721 Transcript_1319/m.1721 type:complete len:218 (-) Transcript_1319:193-846(-)